MAPRKRNNLLPRRRRHDDDDGEDDASTIGDGAAYASSEASLGSDLEGDDNITLDSADDDNNTSAAPSPNITREQAQPFRVLPDTEAMVHGLRISGDEPIEELDYDEAAARSVSADGIKRPHYNQRTKSAQNLQTRQRIVGDPSYNSKKGYFLHDSRHAATGGDQYASRGRGRGAYIQSHRGGHIQRTSASPKQWQHDLHETVNKPPSPTSRNAPKQSMVPTQPAAHAATSAPNRSFSTTTVLGNVSVNVGLPGLDRKIGKTMVKKHYTLLPQHRPPLRRDKPVRISIPDEHPRYIFPSTERSFIFIPRAMRPNQQQYKNRGRGSFHTSRRPSIYGASMYTPSVGMSRRPSFAASISGSGAHTPVASNAGPLSTSMHQHSQQPIVRMPGQVNSTMPIVPNSDVFYGDNAAIIHSPPSNLPMHQPRPYKAVSVDQIESPTRSGPLPQQPFHQQIPQDLQQQKMPHIPEGAVYAQPFQPYSAYSQQQHHQHQHQHHQPQQPFYPMQYPPQMMGDMNYPYSVMPSSNDGAHPAGPPVPHESNGMVYYYDPTQQFMSTPQMAMSMIPPGGGYYYPTMPNPMFYQ